MRLGHITLNNDTGIHVGQITTLDKDFQFEMTPRQKNNPGNDKEPDYKIEIKGSHGKYFEAGAAWKKVGERHGTQFLTISMDAPEWSTPLNVSAFQDKEDIRKMNIAYSRPTRRTTGQDNEATADQQAA